MKKTYAEMNLMEFACKEGDDIRLYAISDKTHDDWMTGEPPEGYHHLKHLGTMTVETTNLNHALEMIKALELDIQAKQSFDDDELEHWDVIICLKQIEAQMKTGEPFPFTVDIPE
jgi:hypothetical protein